MKKPKLTAKERWRKGYSQYRYLTNILGKDKWHTRHLEQYENIDMACYGWDTLFPNMSLVELMYSVRKAYNSIIPDDAKTGIIRRRMKSNYIPLSPIRYEDND